MRGFLAVLVAVVVVGSAAAGFWFPILAPAVGLALAIPMAVAVGWFIAVRTSIAQYTAGQWRFVCMLRKPEDAATASKFLTEVVQYVAARLANTPPKSTEAIQAAQAVDYWNKKAKEEQAEKRLRVRFKLKMAEALQKAVADAKVEADAKIAALEQQLATAAAAAKPPVPQPARTCAYCAAPAAGLRANRDLCRKHIAEYDSAKKTKQAATP